MELAKQDINGQSAKEKLFAKEKIECTQTEYHRDVRDAIIDFKLRQSDLGNTELAAHCQSELERLDSQHGLPPK